MEKVGKRNKARKFSMFILLKEFKSSRPVLSSSVHILEPQRKEKKFDLLKGVQTREAKKFDSREFLGLLKEEKNI
jgi:hypothetical protein